MAILPINNVSSPISADLMYKFYDNKAITPQIRAALQKREDAENASSASGAGPDPSKPGPATRVNITDQIVRMNMADKTTKTENNTVNSDTSAKRPARFDVLEEVKKSVAARESQTQEAKDARLKEIADKVKADEDSKKPVEESKDDSED